MEKIFTIIFTFYTLYLFSSVLIDCFKFRFMKTELNQSLDYKLKPRYVRTLHNVGVYLLMMVILLFLINNLEYIFTSIREMLRL